MARHERVSRRTWLANLMLLMGAAGLAPFKARSTTEGKVSKAVAHYQDHPKGMQMCGMCKYFQGRGMDGGMMGGGMMGHGMMGHGMSRGMMTGECQPVEGKISMMAGANCTRREAREASSAVRPAVRGEYVAVRDSAFDRSLPSLVEWRITLPLIRPANSARAGGAGRAGLLPRARRLLHRGWPR